MTDAGDPSDIEVRARLRLNNVVEYLIVLAMQRPPGDETPFPMGQFALASYVTQVQQEELSRTQFLAQDEFAAIRRDLRQRSDTRGKGGNEFNASLHRQLAIMRYLDAEDHIMLRVWELLPAPPQF